MGAAPIKKRAWKAAFPHTIPVLAGYLFLGFAYGIVMQSAGMPLWLSAMMSVFVYAGSMQYAAVPLLAAPFAPASALFLTLMVNARHLFYGIAMLEPYRKAGRKAPYLIASLTDETFSVNVSAVPPKGVDKGWFMLFVSLIDHGCWVFATVAGGLVGGAISFDTTGIDFVMTALFAAICTGQWMEHKEHRPALIGFGASLVCLIIFGADQFILPAMACILVLLTLARKQLEAAEVETCQL